MNIYIIFYETYNITEGGIAESMVSSEPIAAFSDKEEADKFLKKILNIVDNKKSSFVMKTVKLDERKEQKE